MIGSMMFRALAILAIGIAPWAAHAQYLGNHADPLLARRAVPYTDSAAMIDHDLARTNGCPSGLPGNPLRATESISRALCANPQARQVWVDIQQQTAALGAARSNYLPTLTGTMSAQQVRGGGASSTVRSNSLNLTWTLFDFGARSADVDSQKALLRALAQTGNATLQNIFLTTAQDYYNAVAAQAQAEAALRAEAVAREVYDAADAKAQAGVASLGDRLQAKTAYGQAVMNRVQAQGDLKNAVGTLAVDMGLSPSASFQIAEASDITSFDSSRVGAIEALLEQVRHEHPAVLAAAARLESARLNTARVKMQGWPTVSLSGSTSGSTGSPRTNAIGLNVSVPIFDGFSRNYQVQAAVASEQTQENALQTAERQVALTVWQSYHALGVSTENLRNAHVLVEDAEKSLDVAKGRYFGGVGTLIDLLNAQNTEASARQQKIRALSQWLANRLQFAASLGRLGFGEIE